MYACANVCMYVCIFPRASERRVLLIVGSVKHFHIFTSHLQIFPFSHPHILTSSHILIFTSSHLHIFSSSHSLLPSCPLALLPSCSLALFFFLLFYFSLKAQGSANETARNATLSHETKFDHQNSCKIAILQPRRQPFGTKWRSIAKDWSKIAILSVPRQPFRTKWGTDVKLRFWSVSRSQPFRTKWGSMAKKWSKIAILSVPRQPFRTKRGSIANYRRRLARERKRCFSSSSEDGSRNSRWIYSWWILYELWKVMVWKSKID